MVTSVKPLISIVINTYRGAHYLRECLDSVLRLEGDYPLQIIVVDDCSEDGTAELVAGYVDDRITFLCPAQNEGAAAAINRAFELVRGEYCARIDYDDAYLPNFLVQTVPALVSNSAATMVCGGIEMVDQNGSSLGFTSPVIQGHRPGSADRLHDLLFDYFVSAPTLLARTAAWKTALPLPAGMNYCDWYLSLKIAQHGQLCVLDSTLARYRIHPANMHSRMILDRTGERDTRWILDQFLADGSRSKLNDEEKKWIRFHHDAAWGDRYFGAGMDSDARRCYGRAMDTSLWRFLVSSSFRRFLGLRMGRANYEQLKRFRRG